MYVNSNGLVKRNVRKSENLLNKLSGNYYEEKNILP